MKNKIIILSLLIIFSHSIRLICNNAQKAYFEKAQKIIDTYVCNQSNIEELKNLIEKNQFNDIEFDKDRNFKDDAKKIIVIRYAQNVLKNIKNENIDDIKNLIDFDLHGLKKQIDFYDSMSRKNNNTTVCDMYKANSVFLEALLHNKNYINLPFYQYNEIQKIASTENNNTSIKKLAGILSIIFIGPYIAYKAIKYYKNKKLKSQKNKEESSQSKKEFEEE